MDNQFIRRSTVGVFLVVLSLALPSATRAQRSGVEIWEATCGRCHVIQPTDKYVAKDWRSIGIHMGIYARLTSAQREAVIAFLVSGAREPTAAQTAPPRPATVATGSAPPAATRQPLRRGETASPSKNRVGP